jgi:hypothetical protein
MVFPSFASISRLVSILKIECSTDSNVSSRVSNGCELVLIALVHFASLFRVLIVCFKIFFGYRQRTSLVSAAGDDGIGIEKWRLL